MDERDNDMTLVRRSARNSVSSAEKIKSAPEIKSASDAPRAPKQENVTGKYVYRSTSDSDMSARKAPPRGASGASPSYKTAPSGRISKEDHDYYRRRLRGENPPKASAKPPIEHAAGATPVKPRPNEPNPPRAASNARRAPKTPTMRLQHIVRTSPKWCTALVAVCAIALLGVGYVGISGIGNYRDYVGKCSILEQDTFYDGVTLEGESLAGLTLLDAMAKYNKNLSDTAASTVITVNALSKSYTIDASAIQMTTDLQTTLSVAYSTGRSGSFEERWSKVSQIAADGMDFSLKRKWNEESLRAKIEDIASQVYVKGQDASADFDFDSCKFSFKEGVTGYEVDTADLYQQVTSAIGSGQTAVSIDAKINTVAPEHDVAFLKEHYGRISAATTDASSSSSNRKTNIKLAAAQFNGMVVQPGDTVSFNETTGKRTEEKGYKSAPAYSGGLAIEDLGGGVCQVSTTLYNAVCKADLEVVDRSPHTHVSTYVDIGLDAAVNWPGQDFKFKNSSEFPIYIVSSFYDGELTFKIYGYQLDDGVYIKLRGEKTGEIQPDEGVEERKDRTLPQGQIKDEPARVGYRAQSYKIYYTKDGDVIKEEKLDDSTYGSSPAIRRIGTGTGN